MTLTGLGVWSAGLRFGDPIEVAQKAAELESLGYSALWIPDIGGPVFDALDRLHDATTTVTAATGILNIWMQTATDTVAWWDDLSVDRRDRTLLGLGVSHGPIVGESWGRPLGVMNGFLDVLDAGGVPTDRHCLAALGPKMLELSARRSAGAHPYLVTPEHTSIARGILGGSGLYVEQGVVLCTDPAAARTAARKAVHHYCDLPNYVNNWKRLGLTDDDVASRSDRLIDALFAWGDAGAIRARIDEHMAAGADHVCIQAITGPGTATAAETWRELAPA